MKSSDSKAGNPARDGTTRSTSDDSLKSDRTSRSAASSGSALKKKKSKSPKPRSPKPSTARTAAPTRAESRFAKSSTDDVLESSKTAMKEKEKINSPSKAAEKDGDIKDCTPEIAPAVPIKPPPQLNIPPAVPVKPLAQLKKPTHSVSVDSVVKSNAPLQPKTPDVEQLPSKFPNFQEKVLKVDLDCLTLGSLELGTVASQLLGEMFEIGTKTPQIQLRKYVMEIMASWPIEISRNPPSVNTGSSNLTTRIASSTSNNDPSSSLEANGNTQMKYHSFAQCVDTLATTVKLLHRNYCGGRRYINIEEEWALGLASLGNCAGHIGRDNSFHVLTGSRISDLYGDANPTERNAVAITLAAVRKYGLLNECDVDGSKRVRYIIINSIMSSNWGSHPTLAAQFQELSQRTIGVYTHRTAAEISNPDDRALMCTMFLHTSIVSHNARSWKIASRWASALHEEFLSQGDELMALQLPRPPHMNRKLASMSALAVSNIDNFVLPSLNLLSALVPKVSTMINAATLNRDLYGEKFRDGVGTSHKATPWNSRTSVEKFHSIVMPEDTRHFSFKGGASYNVTLSGETEITSEDNDSQTKLISNDKSSKKDDSKPSTMYRRIKLKLKPYRKRISACIDSGQWQFMSFSFTILALFLDLLRDATLDTSADRPVNSILLISFVFFLVEMFLMSLANGKYFGSFFFYLDFAGTISLVLDIPYVFNLLGLKGVSADIGLASGAGKAARGARAARAAKMARLVRLIRLARFVRLLKYFASLGGDKKVGDDKADAPSRIGQILAEQMSQRVVLLVLMVLFIGPLLNAERSIDFPLAMTLQCMEYLDTNSLTTFIDDHYNNLDALRNSNFGKVLYLEVKGVQYIKASSKQMDKIRTYPTDNEIYQANSIEEAGCVRGDNGCTVAWFDDRPFHKEEGLFGILLILFMVFLLSLGSWMFVGISRRLVVAPIERMFKVIDIVSFSLNSLKDTHTSHDGEDSDDDDTKSGVFETSFLEEAVLKMAELLNMGYGAAGAEIIQRNLGLSGGSSVETFMAGQKMDAIFAFCDIRKFTNTTEILQENVLRFVNLIGHIVHSNTIHYRGSPNKNIGDAFLLVWKVNNKGGRALNLEIPNDSSDLFTGFGSTKDQSAAVTIADGALKAMVQTCYDLHHINTVPTWELERQLVELNILPPEKGQKDEERELSKADNEMIKGLIDTLVLAGRKVSMGYGLHFGWAIEGAIGSTMKIDASYLSPHVNTAARLEAATKQFGATILMSNDFVIRLSDLNQQLCRRIDSVFLVGKAEPTAIFTWDFWTGESMSENHPLSPLSALAQLPPGNLTCTAYEYCAKFEDGERAYEEGDWTKATSRLFECQKILQNDFPARSLITVMSRFNFNAPPNWSGSRQLTEK